MRKRNIILALLAIAVILAGIAGAAVFGNRALRAYRSAREQLDAALEKIHAVQQKVDSITPEPYVFDDSWIEKGCYIAHAFGGIDGFTYTNSLEAFQVNYSLGHRVFEVDMDYAQDDYSVLLSHHEDHWREITGTAPEVPYTKDSFLNSVIYEKYTPLDLSGLISILAEYPDIFIITDTKYYDRTSIIMQFSQIVREAQAIDPAILDRIVPQIYNEEMFWTLMRVYPFRSVIFTLYQTVWSSESVYDFCFRSGVRCITMPVEDVTTDILSLWKTLGIRVAVHTVNDESSAEQLFREGVDLIYTDFLCQS